MLQRDAVMRSIRAFFYARAFTEVETPLQMNTPCMELHIDAERCGDDSFLRTSPELCHKQLLSAGLERIFEVGKCFRKGEFGPLHHPEYTMLEWYRAYADYRDMLVDTQQLIDAVWPDPVRVWQEMTVRDAFIRFAGWDPVQDYDEDRFDLDLVTKVEPRLKGMGAVFLIDYPVEAAALSRRKDDNPLVAERWELYIDGVELANAYSELTDAVEQRRRFEACASQRAALGKEVYEIDEVFLRALENMPESGGVALGVDRLIMLMAGTASLDEVIAFRGQR